MRYEEIRRVQHTINKGRGKEQLSRITAVDIKCQRKWFTYTRKEDVEQDFIYHHQLHPCNSQWYKKQDISTIQQWLRVFQKELSADHRTYTNILKYFNYLQEKDHLYQLLVQRQRRLTSKYIGNQPGRNIFTYVGKILWQLHASKNEFLIDIHASICNVASQQGIFIDRWEQ